LKAIVGLGNPGRKYSMTRHNVGYMVIDELSNKLGLKFKSGKGEYLYASNNKVILIKPLTYMNNSGIAVQDILQYFKILSTDLLVFIHDLDLPFGKIRIRSNGSSGGHNGIKSILNYLDTDSFHRLKIGISNEQREFIEADKFVLGKFLKEEKVKIEEIINKCVDIVDVFISNDIKESINLNNRNNLTDSNK